MKENLEKIEEQHLNNYRAALLDTIEDNTDVLIQEDFISLFKEPPLASMDLLKSRILNYAKEQLIILSTEQLDSIVQSFRGQMLSELPDIGLARKRFLQEQIETMLQEKEIFTREELVDLLNGTKKQVESLFHTRLESHIQEGLVPQLPLLVETSKNQDINHNDLFLQSASEFVTYRYSSSMEEIVEKKIALKDQTLLNRILEHQERYLFTKENSRLFQEKIKKQ